MQSCMESVLQTCAHVCDGQGGSGGLSATQAAALLLIFILHLDCALLILQIFSMRKSLLVSFPLFSLVFRAFCCLDEIQTEGSGLSRPSFVSRSTRSGRLVLRNVHPLRYLWPPEKNALFSFFPFSVLLLCYAGLSTVGARAVSGEEGGEGGKEKPSRAQWKASELLPQLNLRMNSLLCPSHRARRRITPADSKQRGTVERAEACALHQLHSQHSHLPSLLSCYGKWD